MEQELHSSTPRPAFALNDILNVFDSATYSKLAVQNHNAYVTADPFPHIYIDNFLPLKIAETIAAEYARVDELDTSWKYHDHGHARRHFLEDTTRFSPALRLFASALNSRQFLLFLETISGIESLLPDPYFLGGGAMISGTNGFLDVHVDFNYHHKLQAWRRLNALFYFTPNWQKEWKGDLELWSTDKKHKVKSIEPVFNRIVIFNTTSISYHGQPEPLQTPENIYRRVFSAFFYSMQRDEKSEIEPHFTKYALENSPYSQKIGEDYRNKGMY
jgi:hypothetical protein